MLDLIAQFLFLSLDLGTKLVQAVDLLVQLIDGLVFERIVAVFGIQFLDESLEFLLLSFHINGVAFQIVVLLLLELCI